MGLFSSKSKSTKVTNVDETVTTNVDNRIAEGDKVFQGGNVSVTAGDTVDNVTISTTDFGAIDRAAELSERSVGAVETISSQSTEALQKTVDKAVKVAESAAADEGARTIQLVVVGAIVVAGIYFMVKK